ncbi:M23 family metallopeptidase [Fodinibius sp. Rm-B-1B1-1]|uniref:M23 family metallopeptidase n=1 Tax=Fodinibius alkaliphilus TaxID=3140241 RepID=UPI003159BD69
MLDFLKRLFKSQGQDLTFVIFDDDPESSTSYTFKPSRLWNLFYLSLLGVVIIVLLVVMFTPISGLLYDSHDAQLREDVIEISKEVQALKDSLEARDSQLSEMQQVIASGSDTSFSVNRQQSFVMQAMGSESSELDFTSEVSTKGMLSQNEIIFSKIFKQAPEFPTDFPVNGTFTRGYNPETNHYGIDIATKQGISFEAIADGSIVNQDWTVNYGYVIHVQHSNGIITVYKHAASVSKSVGDIVLKGDVLGTTGDVGVLSSGPHLHLEVWKNGVPQNPNTYLIKP